MKKNRTRTVFGWLAAASAAIGAGCADSDDGGGAPGDGGTQASMLGDRPFPPDEEEQCDLHTDYVGDEYCLAPPEPGTGIQVHAGPTNYDDPKEVEPFLLGPGLEVTECYYLKSPNPDNEFYFPRKIRMRPGSHHLISYFIDVDMPDGWGPCTGDRRGSFGGAERTKVDYPQVVPPAPENAGLGKVLPRHAQIKLEWHHLNTTDEPILREAWINVYWKKKEEVTSWVQDMFMIGSQGMASPPGSRQIYNNRCAIDGDTRILDIFGHFHAHTTRFTAWRNRGDERTLIYEVYDWHDTPTLAYDSATDNPAPDRASLRPGGVSGLLDVKKGDVIEWECEVDNTTDITLRIGNKAETAEMCNFFGTYESNSAALMMCGSRAQVTDL